jgi:non-ribosomal peptide synthetase component F
MSLRSGPLPASVSTVALAGEPLPAALAAALHRAGTVRRVVNLYGPSEDTTYSTIAEIGPEEAGAPPIGRPVAGTRAYVLDAALRPVLPGVPGELCLAGEGLAISRGGGRAARLRGALCGAAHAGRRGPHGHLDRAARPRAGRSVRSLLRSGRPLSVGGAADGADRAVHRQGRRRTSALTLTLSPRRGRQRRTRDRGKDLHADQPLLFERGLRSGRPSLPLRAAVCR